MVEKKETAKKTTPKVVKKAAPAKPKKQPQAPKEQQFFLKDLAERMGITSFDYLLIKREYGYTDNTPITASEMKKIYDEMNLGR